MYQVFQKITFRAGFIQVAYASSLLSNSVKALNGIEGIDFNHGNPHWPYPTSIYQQT